MNCNIPEWTEMQQLHIRFEKKEINQTEYEQERSRLDAIIREKLHNELNANVIQKFDDVKEKVEKKTVSKYKVYKEIVELHRYAKMVCDDIKQYKKSFSSGELQ